jgi:hypothetical protein
MAYGIVLTKWYIDQMVKHNNTLMDNILRKQVRCVMYVLRSQPMGSILME